MAKETTLRYGVLKRSFTAVSIFLGAAVQIGVLIFEVWLRVLITPPSAPSIGTPEAMIQLVNLV